MKPVLAAAALAAFACLPPVARAAADPSYPAFTTDPADIETAAKDQIWQRDRDKACAQFRNQTAFSAPEAEACQRLADQQPRCLGYRDFAAIYLKMRDDGAVYADVAEGVTAMKQNTRLYPPDFYNALRKLFQLVFFTEREKLGTVEEFSARAYGACMAGHLL